MNKFISITAKSIYCRLYVCVFRANLKIIFLILSYCVLYLSIWIFCVDVCLCTVCMPVAQAAQKRASDFLGWRYRQVMSHRIGAGN